MKKQLRLGAPLQILNKQDRRHYTAGIREIGTDRFSIFPPVCSGEKLHLPPGSRWPACLVGLDALYYFTAVVLTAGSQDPSFEGYTILRPKVVYRRQRRKYVRISCILHIKYWPIAEVEDLKKPAYPGYPAVVIDMSGGGLRMVTRHNIPRRTWLLLEITLENGGEVHRIEGMVVRVKAVKYNSSNRYRVGVSFNTDFRTREKIIRYLFALMRRRLKDCHP